MGLLAAAWRPPALRTCSIITTTPNALLAPVHDRMPAILPPEAWPLWLDPEARDRGELRALLRRAPEDGVVAYPVGRLVNRPANDGPELVEPVAVAVP